MKKDLLFWLTIAAIVGLATWGGKKVYDMTRGLRNNNPGNIRLATGTTWEGQVPASQQTDPSFVQFTDPVYGIRAMARILANYAARGITSLSDVIATWAPGNENDTGSYLLDVAQETGFEIDRQLTSSDYPAVIAAIIKHENGVQPYADATIAQGFALA